MDFPYGKAPLAILILCVISGVAVFLSGRSTASTRPDVVFATFTKEHAAAYAGAIAEFEKEHDVRVQVQVVSQPALQGRLQSSLSVGAAVPDMVELLDGTLGVFAKGPVEDVGLVDLTDRVNRAGLMEKLVTSRFGKWSSRGHVFALPHDVHPVMLAYRKDIVESLGIDVTKLTTWAEFSRVGRDVVTKDYDGDGNADRYMIDLPAEGGDAVRFLLLQNGGAMFTPAGDVAFDSEAAVEVVCWYVRNANGKGRISFPAGWGQNLAKVMNDGLVLFYFCPDWRLNQFMTDTPGLTGKLGLIPLPAWTEGGPRTSTWGGTGLAITKQCANPDLAWELAMHLYYDPHKLGERYGETHILPPLKVAWAEPQVDAPSSFFSGIKLGRAYVDLAGQVPEEQSSAYTKQAVDKLSEAFGNAQLYYAEHGDVDLSEFTRAELKRCADRVRVVMKRNVFLREDAASVASAKEAR